MDAVIKATCNAQGEFVRLMTVRCVYDARSKSETWVKQVKATCASKAIGKNEWG